MSIAIIPDKKELELEFRRRADFDFIKRALPGVYLYLCAWPVIFFWTGFFEQQLYLSVVFGLLFTITSGLRLLHGKYTGRLYDSKYHFWNSSLVFLCMVHAATWGVLFYMANLDPRFEEISSIVNLVIAGIATGSVQSLIPKYGLTRLYIAAVILPTIVGTLWSGDQFELAFICLLFWLYLAGIGKRFRREYERAYIIEKELYQNQQKLDELNKTDPLTKCRNRRDFDEQLSLKWQHAIDTQKTVSLLMLDIDHFKSINDNYGHPTGDLCLKHFASTLESLIKDNGGALYRYGGEEFSTIILSADEQEILKFAEDIRKRIENTYVTDKHKKIKMTLSIGVCSVAATTNHSITELLDCADRALYKAKQSGRNRVIQQNL